MCFFRVELQGNKKIKENKMKKLTALKTLK